MTDTSAEKKKRDEDNDAALAFLLVGLGIEASQLVERALLSAISLGNDIVQFATAIEGVLNDALFRALSIATNFIADAFRGSQLDEYRSDDSETVIGFTRQLSGGNNCLACVLDVGVVHDISDELELHGGCQCTAIPVMANSPDMQSGSDYFQSLDTSEQRDIMNNDSLYRAWDAGEFSLDEIIGHNQDGTFYVKSLKELLGKKGAQEYYG